MKCSDCGYLSLRDLPTGELYSPATNYRKTGETPLAEHRGSPFPICLMRVADYCKELGVEKEGHHAPANAVLKSLHSERQCKEFTPWQQGLSPKEHLEMNILERQQAALQAAQERHAAQERQWRKEDTRFRFVELIVMGGIVTLVSVAAQIIAAYISRS